MKNLTKFVLSAVLCGVFVACGDDSSTSANGSSDIPGSSSSVIPGTDPESPVSSSEVSSSSVVDPSTVVKGTMTDERDGKVYKTVTIGEQTWMAENLNYAYLQPTADVDSSSFYYENSADSCAKCGRLYLWSAAMDSAAVFSDDGKGCGYYENCFASGTVRGVCPVGWHLPSSTEWSTLFDAVGGTSTAGTMLKSTNGWYNGRNGEDSFGFSVLPAGGRHSDGYFLRAGDNAYFWSSSERDRYDAHNWHFYCNYAGTSETTYGKYAAFSVRCVRD